MRGWVGGVGGWPYYCTWYIQHVTQQSYFGFAGVAAYIATAVVASYHYSSILYYESHLGGATGLYQAFFTSKLEYARHVPRSLQRIVWTGARWRQTTRALRTAISQDAYSCIRPYVLTVSCAPQHRF